MTDRPRPPGQPLSRMLADLPETLRVRVLNAVHAGLFNASRAARAVADPGLRHRETDLQLLAYLSEAIRELEAARAIVAVAAGGRVTR